MFCGRGKVKRYSGEAVLFKVLGDKDQDLPFMLSERKSAGGDLRANFIDLFFKNTWKRELHFFPIKL